MARVLPTRIAVTGAAGNLGSKLVTSLLEDSACDRIIAIDRSPVGAQDRRVVPVVADLRQRDDPAWRDTVAEADAVVHLAAQRPYPDADWTDAARSFDMTANIMEAAAAGRVRRFVFASSNHVMGRYKDTEVADRPGSLTPQLPPLVGTQAGIIDATAYAAAKLMGERLLAAVATFGGMTGVSLRIGWCQPGDNDPATITLTGLPEIGGPPVSASEQRDFRWFRLMWLSNRDFVGAVRCALTADPGRWPSAAVVVNAMSDNAGMCWDLKESTRLIGYRPIDRISKSCVKSAS